jgi:hypothetical protein
MVQVHAQVKDASAARMGILEEAKKKKDYAQSFWICGRLHGVVGMCFPLAGITMQGVSLHA